MRLHLDWEITEPIGFDYQYRLAGTIHRWLGENSLHGRLSLLSYGKIYGARLAADRSGLVYDNGGKWFISSYHDDVIERLADACTNEPEIFRGVRVLACRVSCPPRLGCW